MFKTSKNGRKDKRTCKGSGRTPKQKEQVLSVRAKRNNIDIYIDLNYNK